MKRFLFFFGLSHGSLHLAGNRLAEHRHLSPLPVHVICSSVSYVQILCDSLALPVCGKFAYTAHLTWLAWMMSMTGSGTAARSS